MLKNYNESQQGIIDKMSGYIADFLDKFAKYSYMTSEEELRSLGYLQ